MLGCRFARCPFQSNVGKSDVEQQDIDPRGENWQGACLAWVGSTQAALILATWPLWWPPVNVGAELASARWLFPQVPLIAAARELPVWLDRVAVVCWLLGLLGQTLAGLWLAWGPSRNNSANARPWSWLLQASVVCCLVAWPVLVVSNQHRFQAWAYLAWWIGLFWLLASRMSGKVPSDPLGFVTRWRWLAISVYFYSAVSKFDVTFLQSLGNQFATALWNLVSLSDLPMDTVWPSSLIFLFPLGELFLALGLGSGYLRRSFCLLAFVMHGLLLLILGPWGLQHQPGVLIWNLFFIGQAYLLFWPTEREKPCEDTERPRSSRLANLALYVVLLWPLTQPWGWCDHWPAWELYAPRGNRIQVFLASPAWESATDLAEFAADQPSEQHGPIWRELRLDQWSLQQLHAPIYPQDRFQLGVAEYVLERVPQEQYVLIQWYGPADRWSGKREQRLLRGRREVKEFGQRFFWNTRPR